MDRLEKAVENLKEYIAQDVIYQNKDIENPSDFDKFCINHCEDIEVVLQELENKDNESHFIQSESDKANAEIIELKRMIDFMLLDLSRTAKVFESSITNSEYIVLAEDFCFPEDTEKLREYYKKKVRETK